MQIIVNPFGAKAFIHNTDDPSVKFLLGFKVVLLAPESLDQKAGLWSHGGRA